MRDTINIVRKNLPPGTHSFVLRRRHGFCCRDIRTPRWYAAILAGQGPTNTHARSTDPSYYTLNTGQLQFVVLIIRYGNIGLIVSDN